MIEYKKGHAITPASAGCLSGQNGKAREKKKKARVIDSSGEDETEMHGEVTVRSDRETTFGARSPTVKEQKGGSIERPLSRHLT